jgi:hypothetical protein
MTMIRPETVVRWHRAGVRRYWRWKSRWSRSAICFRNVHPTNRRWKVAPKPLQAAAVKSGPRGRDGGVCQELAAGMIRDLVLQKWHRRSNFRNRAVVERAGVHYRPIVTVTPVVPENSIPADLASALHPQTFLTFKISDEILAPRTLAIVRRRREGTNWPRSLSIRR